LVKVITAHFSPTPNESAERARFYKRMQHEGETISEYVSQLRQLSLHCKFGDLQDRIKDQLLVGVREKTIQNKLLSTKALTYATAVEAATEVELALKESKRLR